MSYDTLGNKQRPSKGGLHIVCRTKRRPSNYLASELSLTSNSTLKRLERATKHRIMLDKQKSTKVDKQKSTK